MFKTITLEISLKPFKETSDKYIKFICENVFDQWKALIRDAETVKILMWSSAGSELLDYRGSLNDEFEWAYMIGHANPRGDYPREYDPTGKAMNIFHIMTEPVQHNTKTQYGSVLLSVPTM